MKCPKCGFAIPTKRIAQDMGARGGKKSKRILTPDQARMMVRCREEKKLLRKENES